MSNVLIVPYHYCYLKLKGLDYNLRNNLIHVDEN